MYESKSQETHPATSPVGDGGEHLSYTHTHSPAHSGLPSLSLLAPYSPFHFGSWGGGRVDGISGEKALKYSNCNIYMLYPEV